MNLYTAFEYFKLGLPYHNIVKVNTVLPRYYFDESEYNKFNYLRYRKTPFYKKDFIILRKDQPYFTYSNPGIKPLAKEQPGKVWSPKHEPRKNYPSNNEQMITLDIIEGLFNGDLGYKLIGENEHVYVWSLT